MRREEVRAFLQSGVDALSPKISFNAGRVSEFASEKDKEFPYVWLETLKRNTPEAVFTNTWDVVYYVAKLDKMDSLPVQYEALIDDCDYIAQQLEAQYKFVLNNNKLTIGEVSTEPFIKKNTPDVTTGVTISFTITDFSPTPIC